MTPVIVLYDWGYFVHPQNKFILDGYEIINEREWRI